MGYTQSYPKSARRHRDAADSLFELTEGHDVAGYLYGIAAECAFKELMNRSGMRPDPDLGRDDPFALHFPKLKGAFKTHARGRRAGDLMKFVETAFMNEWDTDMRYAPRKDISVALVKRWKSDAERILQELEKP